MKKFMKAFVGVITRLALVAIVIVGVMGINEFFGDTGMIVLLCVVSGAWIVLGIFDDDVEANDYRRRYEEAQKREKLFQKALREKRAEIAYWREQYESVVKSVKQ